MNHLVELQCCMPNRPEHFVSDPKFLSCGDYICSECIPNSCNEIKCARCNRINALNLSKQPLVKALDKLFEINLKELSEMLYSKMVITDDEIKITFSFFSITFPRVVVYF